MSDNLKNWPEKIYFQISSDDADELPHSFNVGKVDLTFCKKRINENDVKYIRADIAQKEKAELKETIEQMTELCMRHINVTLELKRKQRERETKLIQATAFISRMSSNNNHATNCKFPESAMGIIYRSAGLEEVE